MNDLKPTQLPLFEWSGPRWNTLPRERQQQLLEVLSQMLLGALECRRNHDRISETNTETHEDQHVS